ncbi:alpha/beta fold hydrolase [Vitiosangium sp. GDMCC 1.1324]|uniref:alpha/beta fold hydrolase n=1 Tax=Vitiosangium sp. (strain GDMCC 1.1324) TaxID=2138576 RepID=UPI000D3BEFC4|nr:alpha/beta hydrolase [Vitiosangium sp. GDMCC 1.1324]PTL76599.1 alpha/beta hydrolase [Vitiosangium sp. GDMCC 1.1324]
MTFSTRTVRGAVGQLAVTTAGEGGLSVLFIHGNSGNRTQWAAQQAHLKQRSVSFDLRGMGESDPDPAGRYGYADHVPDVGAVADALGLERFVLVAHSFGCAVAGEYAARHPERVVGLVLGDPGPSVKHIPPHLLAPLREGLKPENYESFRVGWFESMLQGARPETHQAVMDSLRATPREVVSSAILSLFDLEPEEVLARYPGPILDIAAEATVTQAGPLALHLRVPRMQVKVLSGVSHWLMMDAPEAFNTALDGFLASITSARA